MGNRPPPPPLPHLQDFAGSQEARRKRQERIEAEEQKLYVTGKGEKTAVHVSDVGQTGGPIGFHGGDCWVAAGLAAVVQMHTEKDEFMKDVITNNGDGTYTVTFFEVKDGSRTPIPVLLDAKDVGEIRAGLANGHALTSDDRAGDTPELWPALVEKAYLKEYPTQGGAPSQMMERLTGMPSQFVPFPGLLQKAPWPQGAGDVPKVTLEGLAALHKDKYAIALGTFTDDNPNYRQPAYSESHPAYSEAGRAEPLYPNHAYFVTGVDLMKRTVTVQNPWQGSHKDIVIPYDDVQKVFASASLNPVMYDPGSAAALGIAYPMRR
jgi:hypothetical protein